MSKAAIRAGETIPDDLFLCLRPLGCTGIGHGFTADFGGHDINRRLLVREIGMKGDAFYATILLLLLPPKAKGSSEAVR